MFVTDFYFYRIRNVLKIICYITSVFKNDCSSVLIPMDNILKTCTIKFMRANKFLSLFYVYLNY